MTLTPQQVADLRSAKNVRGQVGERPLWQVSVMNTTFERVLVLTELGEMPGVVWYYAMSNGPRVNLMTNQPEFFMELEGKIIDAVRPR